LFLYSEQTEVVTTSMGNKMTHFLGKRKKINKIYVHI